MNPIFFSHPTNVCLEHGETKGKKGKLFHYLILEERLGEMKKESVEHKRSYPSFFWHIRS